MWGWKAAEPEPEPEVPAEEAAQPREVGNVQELHCLGTLPRASRARVSTLRFDTTGSGVLAVQSADKSVEIFRARAAQEVSKKLKRKEKRRREKARLKGETVESTEDTTGLQARPALEYEQVCVVRADSKIRSLALAPKLRKGGEDGGKTLPVLLALANNRLEVHDLDVAGKAVSKRGGVHLPGHRSDIRAVALSSDDELLLSTSHHDAKVWNLRSQECIRTIPTGDGLCGMFLPGDRQVSPCRFRVLFCSASVRMIQMFFAYQRIVTTTILTTFIHITHRI